MRRIGLVLVAVVIGMGAASCSNTVSKADFKKELDNAGLGAGGTLDTQCVVDKLEAQGFKFRKYGEVTGDDEAKMKVAVTECIKISIPSVPSISVPK